MTTHGQRFRRRALRRGYKVDEVDAFLDRVEATAAGEPTDAPVTAQEVHDVVFRVRFGGYDEWQVDLHLDRAERQLAEAMERGAPFGRGPAGPRPAPSPPAGPLGGYAEPPPPLPSRPVPAPGPSPEPAGYAGYEQETYGGGYDTGMLGAGPAGRGDMTTEMRLGDPGGPPAPRPGPPGMPDRGFPDYMPDRGMPDRGMPDPGMPEPAGPGPAGPPGHMGRPSGGMAGPGAPTPAFPPMTGGGGMGGPAGGPMGPPGGAAPADLQRLDQLRRAFQPRRFGSGYDRAQVDRLFEEVLVGISGQGPLTVTDADLDSSRFDLVPGGYFEAEVDNALQEARSILRRG